MDTEAFVRDGYAVVRGATARMIAQPGVAVPDGFSLDGSEPSPVARSIVRGLATAR